jgi:hypothetical protein
MLTRHCALCCSHEVHSRSGVSRQPHQSLTNLGRCGLGSPWILAYSVSLLYSRIRNNDTATHEPSVASNTRRIRASRTVSLSQIAHWAGAVARAPADPWQLIEPNNNPTANEDGATAHDVSSLPPRLNSSTETPTTKITPVLPSASQCCSFWIMHMQCGDAHATSVAQGPSRPSMRRCVPVRWVLVFLEAGTQPGMGLGVASRQGTFGCAVHQSSM